jgi:type IV secretory pathway TraG/TraD family ATPase VirD4
MERVRRQPASGHPVLMTLDEFAGLKRMRVLENAAAQIAGFGVKLMFVVQTLVQLKDIYRDNWETIVANAGVKLFFGNDDHFTREYVSRLIGDCEVIRTTRTDGSTDGRSTNESSARPKGGSSGNSSGSSMGVNNSSVTSGSTFGTSWSNATTTAQGTSQSQTISLAQGIHKRPLVAPDEVGRLFGDRHNAAALALIAGLQPLALKRVTYFQDSAFLGLADPHGDHPLPRTLTQIAEWRARERAQALELERIQQESMRFERDQAELAEYERQQDEIWEERQFAKRYAAHQADMRRRVDCVFRTYALALCWLALIPAHFTLAGIVALSCLAFATIKFAEWHLNDKLLTREKIRSLAYLGSLYKD